jgi:branched-chain amino acid transport system ATP-binding protein
LADEHPGNRRATRSVMRALTAEHLTVAFGGVRALDDTSIEVEEEEFLAVVGPNGAGKSTLLNALNRLVPLVHGEITLYDQPVGHLSPVALAKLGVARTFQAPRLIERATVLENLMIGAYTSGGYRWSDQLIRPHRVRRKELEVADRCSELLTAAGMINLGQSLVHSLPYGPRKLIEILRALVGHPKVVLLDEPTSGLGKDEREALTDLILHYRAVERPTVVLVEHHMDFVRSLSDRVVGLNAGQTFAVGTIDEVIEAQDQLLRAEAHAAGGALS